MLKRCWFIFLCALVSSMAPVCYAVDDDWDFREEVKLEPKIRIEPIENARKIIIMEDLEAYLRKAVVLDSKEQFRDTPYIVANSNVELVFGKGSTIYVNGEFDKAEPLFDIYKSSGKYLHHPITGENLGYLVSVVGEAELTESTEPATFTVLSAKEGIHPGARLLPDFAAQLPVSLIVKPAKVKEKGYILSVEGNVDAPSFGMDQVVVISLGEREGLEEGNILKIYKRGKKVIDPTSKSMNPTYIELPETEAGRLLVFKTYDKLSLGLVLEVEGIIRLLDVVKSP